MVVIEYCIGNGNSVVTDYEINEEAIVDDGIDL